MALQRRAQTQNVCGSCGDGVAGLFIGLVGQRGQRGQPRAEDLRLVRESLGPLAGAYEGPSRAPVQVQRQGVLEIRGRDPKQQPHGRRGHLRQGVNLVQRRR